MTLSRHKYIPCFGAAIALDVAIGGKAVTSVKREREVIEKWYRAQARRFFTTGLGELKIEHVTVRISGARTRWGSCNPKRRSLMFNWRLALAPLPIAQHVLVHELAHLTYPNHSRQFWQLVERLDPAFKDHRRWLKQHGHLLHAK